MTINALNIKNLVCALLLLFAGQAQNNSFIEHRHYNLLDGLPSSQLYELMQDSKGNIWFGSDYGVTRFNGQEFRTFTIDDGLADNTVLNCFEDSKGRIWFNHIGNLPSYFYEGRIENVQISPNTPGISHLGRFVESPDGDIYMGAIEGLLKINIAGVAEILPQETRRAINPIQWKDNLFYYLNEPGIDSDFPYASQNVYGFYLDLRLKYQFTGPCVIRSYEALYNLLYKDKIELKPSDDFSDVILVKRKGNKLFSCTDNGLKIYNIENQELVLDTIIRPGLTVSSVIFDQAGGFWISTLNDGLYHFNLNSYVPIDPNDSRVTSIEKVDGKIFAGTINGGVFEISGTDAYPVGNLKSLFELEPEIKNIFKTKKGLVIQLSLGLVEMVIRNDAVTFDLLKEVFATSIIELSKHRYLISTLDGLRILDGDSIVSPFQELHQLNRIYDMVRLGNLIYIGSSQGLFVMEEKNGVLSSPNPFLPEYFSGQRINELLLNKKTLLIGTSKSGVFLLQDGLVYNYNKNNGLLTNRVNKIVQQVDNAYWIVSDAGLQLIDFDKGKVNEFRRVDVKNMLNTTDIRNLIQKGQYLYVLSNAGLHRFDMTDIDPPHKLSLNIDELNVNGFSRSLGNKEIYLPYNEANVKIQVSSVNFTNSRSYYHLSVNDEPPITTTDGSFNLTSLAPGKYEVKLYSTSDFLLQSDALTMVIHVDSAIWQSPVVIFMICLIIVLGLSALIALFFNRRYQHKKRLTSLELQSLQAQMNPHFTFNTMNSIQNFILKNDKRSSLDYLSKFSQLMRRILEQSRIQLVPVRSEKEFLSNYIELEQNRMNHSFDYEITLGPGVEEDRIGVPSMLLQPFVENAIWHGLTELRVPGKLQVGFHIEEDKLICNVRDNGKGREAAKMFKRNKKHRSRGMSITEDRIRLFQELYKTRINFIIEDVNSGSESGTNVRVELPILTIKPQENEE